MSCPKSLLCFLLIAVAASPGAAMNFRMEASTAWAENFNRSAAPSDWRDAHRFELRGALSLLREWHTGFLTTGSLDAAVERVLHYQRFDAVTAGASGQVRQKFGLGAYAPVVAFNAGLHGRNMRLDDNDGWTATAGLQLTKRLTPSWRVAAIGDWQQHYARSAVFDTKHRRVFATVAWDFSERWSLSYGRGRLWGNFTANASPAVWPRALAGALGERVASYYNSIPWEVTSAIDPGWVTYLVDGRVDFWWLELSPVLGRNTSLPLRYESFFSENKVGIKYRQDVWTLQILHRF